MSKSKIEWTDETWNPVTGCTKVSSGCKHCYAERIWPRLAGNQKHVAYGRAFTDVQCHPERLEQPLRWKRPRMVFVNSMSDLFHGDVPDDFIEQIFSVMAQCPDHTFQILTKRPDRMVEIVNELNSREWVRDNIWLGVSVENQETAGERIPKLLATPAAVRFVSVEPMLGPIDLEMALNQFNTLDAMMQMDPPPIQWVICGGESGTKARPMHPDWARGVRDQCVATGVPFFFKQWGEWAPDCWCFGNHLACSTTPRPEPGKPGCMFRCGKKAAGRLLDGREWGEMPYPSNDA